MSRVWTSYSHCRERHIYFRRLCLGIPLILGLFVLSGCGMSWPSDDPPAQQSELASPPILGDRPEGESLPVLGDTNAQTTPTLQGARGLNNALFAEKIRDRDDRLDRLEGAVQGLRNDFDSIQPSITRLIGLEGDIQELVTQLEALLEVENTPPPGPVAPVAATAIAPPQNVMETALAPPQNLQQPKPVMAGDPAMAKPQQISPPPAQKVNNATSASSGQNVVNIRIGEHPDKTRLVLDVNGKADFTHDLDNMERILLVDLPGTGWNAMMQKTFSAKSPIIQSFRTEKTDQGGSLLIVQLKHPAQVTYAKSIGGKTPSQDRIVVDIEKNN